MKLIASISVEVSEFSICHLTATLTYTNFNYVALPVVVFICILVQIIIYAHMEKLVLSVSIDTFL